MKPLRRPRKSTITRVIVDGSELLRRLRAAVADLGPAGAGQPVATAFDQLDRWLRLGGALPDDWTSEGGSQ